MIYEKIIAEIRKIFHFGFIAKIFFTCFKITKLYLMMVYAIKINYKMDLLIIIKSVLVKFIFIECVMVH